MGTWKNVFWGVLSQFWHQNVQKFIILRRKWPKFGPKWAIFYEISWLIPGKTRPTRKMWTRENVCFWPYFESYPPTKTPRADFSSKIAKNRHFSTKKWPFFTILSHFLRSRAPDRQNPSINDPKTGQLWPGVCREWVERFFWACGTQNQP